MKFRTDLFFKLNAIIDLHHICISSRRNAGFRAFSKKQYLIILLYNK